MAISQASPAGPVGDPRAAASPALEGRRRRLSAAMACAVMTVGTAAFVGSRAYAYWTALGPGPGFFPRWLGGLLVLLGAAWLVQLWRGHPGSVSVEAGEPIAAPSVLSPEEEPPAYSLPTVVAIVVSLCVLAAVLEPLGYQLSLLLFLLFHLLVLGRRRLLLSAAIALAGSFGVFTAFTRLLGVPLPTASIPLLRDLGL
jgi:putative tricarboxylic transport membrane protein